MHTLNILTTATIPASLTAYDTLLLIEDSVYLLLEPKFIEKFSHIYVLERDIQSRLGANADNLDLSRVTKLDYEKFVELCCKFEKNVTW